MVGIIYKVGVDEKGCMSCKPSEVGEPRLIRTSGRGRIPTFSGCIMNLISGRILYKFWRKSWDLRRAK